MKSSTLLSLTFFSAMLVLAGCGKPPSSGGGPPQGDFPVNVVGAPVTVEPLKETLRLVGSFEATDEVILVSETQGAIEELPVVDGEEVTQGRLIARVDDDKIQARLLDARARKRLADANQVRAEELRKTNSISSQEVEQALADADQAAAAVILLEVDLEDSRVTAPMSGRLGEIEVSKGQIVSPGQRLTVLTQTDPIEVRFEVPERNVAAVKTGQKVEIRTEAYAGELFTGTVVFLAPSLRTSTRSLLVKATVANPDGRLKPGMLGQVDLVLREEPEALFVPESAVMQQGTGTTVMVRNAEGRSEVRPVTVGIRQKGRMQILSGLQADDLVVAEGLIKTRPGTLLHFSEDSRRFGLEPDAMPANSGDEPSEDPGA